MKSRLTPIQATVQNLMNQYGIRPTKKRGQNFLIDEDVYKNILETSRLSNTDTVLEIGPGLGILTGYLGELAGKVVAVELDKKLVQLLEDTFAQNEKVSIKEGDILDKSVVDYGVQAPYKVVANIPYNITAPILRKFLVDDIQPTSMTLLVQREVGERITAEPGEMSVLAISVQLYGSPSLVSLVSREAFVPAPEVESCVVHIKDIHPFPYSDVAERDFWRVVKVGFAAKRKQLKNNLSSGLQLSIADVVNALEKLDLPPTARAQELSVKQWYSLSTILTQ